MHYSDKFAGQENKFLQGYISDSNATIFAAVWCNLGKVRAIHSSKHWTTEWRNKALTRSCRQKSDLLQRKKKEIGMGR